MILLHRIGPRISSNWNLLTEILALPKEVPLSFDGIYSEVYEHYKELKGRNITFFVSGKYVGKDNSFDLHSGERPGNFCTWPQIAEMADYLGARVGYHGMNHKPCVGMNVIELLEEIGLPFRCPIKPLLAWPHGVCDDKAVSVARELGYKEAWCAGPHGDGSQFQRKRSYLNW